ncbi:restriction endonuclease [Raoultella terrigena]|uniref:restriction endonuclease n=1 Tax=Raoultella terrigena TaxID=577 RepID=UPI0025AEF982|nr:restriction endonuclease [Raoultella terrigena]WJV37938.1 restriction endonuclease [Raoultella terrigena]
MIDDPLPDDWRELQAGVQRIFRNVGMKADVEVDLQTPRGTINVDVLAIDTRSVDKIKYIVECKNWSNSIPQSVVHSFTTVMHETGANIGFIVTKQGLQQGAIQYTKNTNIVGMTYLEFQERYFEAWWKRYFCPRIGDAADEPFQYVEPFNSQRDREYDRLTPEKQDCFDRLKKDTEIIVTFFTMFNIGIMPKLFKKSDILIPQKNLDEFKSKLSTLLGFAVNTDCRTFRDLLEAIINYLLEVKRKFDAIFGGSIFEPKHSFSGVTFDGPPLDEGIY